MMDGVVTLVGLVVVAGYTWSLRGHFVAETMPQGARVISAAVTLTTVLFVALTWFALQPVWAQVLGVALQLAGAALFVAAVKASRQARLRFAFTPEKPEGLVESGPYRYVRHPFYVSYIIFWSGWALATWSVLSLISVCILVALYVIAARREEDSFAHTPLAADYAAYRNKAGFFWPRLG